MKPLLLRSLILAILSVVYWLWQIASYLHVPLFIVSSRLSEKLYIPSHNFFKVGYFRNVNLNFFFYGLIIVFSLIILISRRKFVGFRNRKLFYEILFPVTLSIFSIYIVFQTFGQLKIWYLSYVQFQGKTSAQKNYDIYGQPYPFASNCRHILPGSHIGRLFSDLDMSVDPGMIIHRELAYFLYPIDIRGIRKGDPDCLIFYSKKDAARYIPQGYAILKQFDKNNLLAVKKESK